MTTIDELLALREKARSGDPAAVDAYQRALDGLLPSVTPDVPLLMLPVRLETRYRPLRADGSRHLMIRIYPDDVHEDSHEPGLTADERVAGTTFWTEVWRAGAGAAGAQGRRQAWQRLSDRFGAHRGAWIVTALRPTNPDDAPAQPVDADAELSVPPAWPDVATAAARWGRASHTTVLPDRWLAFGYAGGALVFEQWGEPIPRPLPTGPSPDEGAGGPTGAGTDWMVDFGAAVNAGMAVQVLLRADMPHEFDLVGVVGVQATTDPAQSAAALGDLLTAHAYSWGCDLVPVGTPTNNDGAAATAGYAAHGRAAAGDGERLTDDADAADPDDDLDRLAAAFGIAVPEALRRSPNAGLRGQADARAMATALWPATWGYFLTQLLAPEHDGSPVAAWRRFTLDTVRGRGPLPALRVGPQPYGVLPVTATRLWRTTHTGLVSVTASGASCTLLDTWSVDPATGPGPTTTQSLPRVTVMGRFANARLALGELDGLVRTFLLEPGAAGAAATLRPGPVVDGTGAADGGWQNSVSLPAPFAPAGAGLCAAVGPGGTFAVLRLVAAPRGQLLSAALGNRLRPDATVSGWLDVGGSAIAVQPTDRLLGAAASDATSTGTVDLYALVAETGGGLTCRVATAVDQRGVRWGAPVAVPVPTGTVVAATAALSDVDGDRRAELVVSMLAGNQQWLAVGRLARDGSIAGGWAGPWPVGPAVPAGTECLGFLPVRFGASPLAPPYSPPRLVHLLATASEPWLARTDSGAVPFVGRGDPDTDLLRILASDAVSGTVRLRRLMGMAYLLGLYRVAGLPVPANATQVLIARTSAALQAELGLPVGDRRLQAMAYLDPPDAYAEPWVQDGELSDVDTLAANHLAWAAKAEPDQLHDRAAWPGGDSLLRRLVRHSTLQGWADVAMRIAPLSPLLREPELVDVPDLRDADPRPAGHTLTSWRYLSEPQGGRRLADEVRARLAGNDPAAADLAELCAALAHLATVPTAALHHLLGETLDLAGHRLDAWVTAVATQRLGELRATRPDGLHLGGYGFVEKLAPADSAPVTTGFVHAPSLVHATTAAVLRSGYLSHAGRPTAAGLAVDLSSARVRSALELLDGVRAGQSLGALLGYRFERALRDGGVLARYLPAFRQLFPLTAGRLHDLPATTPVADVAARQVCDGLGLVRTGAAGIAWGGTPAGSGVALPAASSGDHTALVGILATVTDALDAACDLATAESVFQAASGNPARVGAVLDALNRGEVPPPVPEVVRSARSGVVVNHRVLVTLAAPDPADLAILAWAASVGRPRALAEPRLDAWAARLLGDPARIRWRAVAGPTTRTYTVADLGLCPLDLVYADDLTPGSDLYATLMLHAAGGLAEPQLVLDRDPVWAADVVSVGEALTVAGAVRELFTASRPMTPADLLPPGASAAPGPDALADRARDTASRLTTARNALRELFDLADPVTDRATLADLTGIPAADLADLTNLLDLPPSVDLAEAAAAVLAPDPDRPGELRSALLGVAAFGVRGAVPRTGPDDDLDAQAQPAAREVAARLAAVGSAGSGRAALEALLGPEFRALPVFTAGNAAALAAAVAARAAAGDAGPTATAGWLSQLADVRDGVGRLDRALLLAEAVTAGPVAEVRVAQLSGDQAAPEPRWSALPTPPPAGRVSLALVGPSTGVSGPVAGLLVDDWAEVVPARQETTAIAFHFDNPDSCPPQTALLGVPPEPGRPWTAEILRATVRETYDLGRMRAVDPDTAPENLAHFLPALTLASNTGGDPNGDTISTVFA